MLLLFYRSEKVREHLQRQPNRLVVTKRGIDWQPTPPRRKPVPGWLLTTRVAAFSYSPLMLVGCVVAIGLIFDGNVSAVPLIGAWFVAGLVTSYAVLVVSIFLVRGQGWARAALGWLTVIVLAIDLPLCWLLLGVDGLVRDGGPLLASALLVLYGLSRTPAIAGNTYQTKT